MKRIALILIMLMWFLPSAYAADLKISELPAITAPTSDDLLVIVDSPSGTPATSKITVGNLLGTVETRYYVSKYATFQAAKTAAEVTGGTLVLDAPSTCSANTTVANTVSIQAMKGGIISHTTYTITINGNFEAGLYQVFNGTGAVSLPTVTSLRPEWWGGGAGVASATNTLAINQAIGSINTNGGILQFSPGTYESAEWNKIIPLESSRLSTKIRGAGSRSTTLYFNTSDVAITIGDTAGLVNEPIIEDLTFLSNAYNPAAFIRLTSVRSAIIQNCLFYQSAKNAIENIQGYGVHVKNCQFSPATWTTKGRGILWHYHAYQATDDLSIATTDVNATTNVITVGTATRYTGQTVYITSTETPPAPLRNGYTYFLIVDSATAVKLAYTERDAEDGTAIDITDVGSGTHSMAGYDTWSNANWIDGADFYANSPTYYDGIYIEGGYAHSIHNSIFEGFGANSNAIRTDSAALIHNQTDALAIDSCYFESNTNYAIYNDDSAYYTTGRVNVRNSYFYNATAEKVYIGTNGQFVFDNVHGSAGGGNHLAITGGAGGGARVFLINTSGYTLDANVVNRIDYSGAIALKETGTTPTYYTIFQSGDLTGANSTYTWPTGLPGVTGYCLTATDAGVMSWAACSAATGDVTSVGDCTTGACLDGTSDGGTNIAFYDGTGNKLTVAAQASALGADKLLYLPTTATNGQYLKVGVSGNTWTLSTDTPGGSGDVTGAGDCSSGDCLDGSSDGGTYIRLYDGTSAYSAITAGVRTLTLAPSNTNAENLVITFGNNDNTVALSSGTGAVVGISGNAATVTNATLTTALTVNTGTVTLVGNAANTSSLTLPAGSLTLGTMASQTAANYATLASPSFTGNIYLGDTANTYMTQGLTLNQGANDDEVLAFKSSDVGHPFTADAEADTFGHFTKTSPTAGGLSLTAFTDATLDGALSLIGVIGATDPTDSHSAVVIKGRKSGGTDAVAALGNAETVFRLDNHNTALITVLGNGATTFTGQITGNVTGNVSGSSGSTTGNAATATALAADPANCSAGQIALGITAAGVAECTATPSGLTSVGATTFTGALTGNASTSTLASTVTVVDSTSATTWVGIYDSATGSLAPKTDAALTYNASTGMLTATGITVGASGITSSKTSGVAGLMSVMEANSTDTSYIGWMGPASIAESYSIQFSNDQPSAGQVMVFAAPTGTGDPNGNKVSAQTWATLSSYAPLASPTFTGSVILPSANADPAATAGSLVHDSTVTNFTNGALRYYNGAAIKQLVDMTAATAEACTNTQVVAYNSSTDLWYCKDDATGAGTTIVDDTIWDAAGDLVQGTGANAAAKLTKGAEGTILRAGATSNAYTTSTFADTYVQGGLLHAATANTVAALAPGAVGSFLMSNGTGAALSYLAAGAANYQLVGAGVTTIPVWTASTGTGSPVLGTAPSFTTSITPNSAGASTIGTTALEWGNVYLTDSAVIYAQANQANSMTSSATGWTFNQPITLGQQTTTAGSIYFQEGSGGGTNLVRLQGPASTADITVTLPAAAGTINVSPTTTTAGQAFLGTATAGLGAWSTPTYPSASGTARKMLVSDGTNNVYSTELWPIATTSGNIMVADGTNWVTTAPTGSGAPMKQTSPTVSTSLVTDSTSFTAFAGATTLLTIGGTGASASLFAPSTLDTTSSITGAIRTSGGISAAKAGNIGTTLTVGTDIVLTSATAGVRLTGGNGLLTIKGEGDGTDEDLTINLNSANVATVSSSTGVTDVNFSALNLVTTGYMAGGVKLLGTFAAPITSTGTYSLAAANCWNTFIFYNDTDTLALPAAVAGMNLCIYTPAATLITIDPNGTDVIVVDGTANAAGDAFTLAAVAGNFVCLVADAANHWVTVGAKGTLTAL